jgi:hypothetical protein
MMRKTMDEKESAYRAIAVWTDAKTGDVLKKVIVGPYSRASTAKGSLTQEIGYVNSYYRTGPIGKFFDQVEKGEVLFDRWVEEAATTWKRL